MGWAPEPSDDEGAAQRVPLKAATAQPTGLDGSPGDGQKELDRQGDEQGGPGNLGQVGQQQGNRDAHGGGSDVTARARPGLLDGVDAEGAQEPGREHHRGAHGGGGPDQSYEVAVQESRPRMGDGDGEEVGQDEPDDEVMARTRPGDCAERLGEVAPGVLLSRDAGAARAGAVSGRTRQGGLRRDDRGWAITVE